MLDDAAVARLVDLGDARLVERIVRVLLADAASRVAEIDEAILLRDVDRLRGALRALEGICALVGAAAIARRVRAIRDEVRPVEGRGGDPFVPALGPSGLEPLLVATRIQLAERLAGSGSAPS